MIVVNSESVKSEETSDEIVGRGPVYRKALIDPKATGGPGVLLVTFGKGARLNFHVHDYEQILYVTEGKGIVATRDKEYVITPGATVFIAPGEDHWHGATADTSMTHLAIQKPGIKLSR
ncbi:MAG: cupin domain-containing protein [Chloroflexota bacterium]